MKTEAWIFGICGIFVWLVSPLYWVMSKDWTGTSALVMTALLATMVFGYLFFHANRLDPRPEDRSDAEIADGAGELGFFPPYSWWPLWCALCLAVMVYAVADRGLVAVHHRRDPRRLGAQRPDLRVLQGRARALKGDSRHAARMRVTHGSVVTLQGKPSIPRGIPACRPVPVPHERRAASWRSRPLP